ncbi:uncharacterized protein EDB93DRAFT_1168378 [Suillus bovinus]|uniref:uncharacterized protein n=1 Tax=Suillus bovinus TaxID=48563 RepID=UPI001B866903|nr:uncharacterized protein EDB93DRAFT_1168378 [Suillus bovinus]KAG2136570.1 hypothetical protein EDB93DRAFT_1168378 [Suillus bovinus]
MTTSQTNLTDRSKLRMERLRLEELEQQRWEQEALVMPEALNQALLMSFASVKTEFSDLDGLSWSRYPVPLVPNPWAIDEPSPTPTPDYPEPSGFPDELEYSQRSQTPSPYTVSSFTGLTSFSPGETIRVPRAPNKLSRSPLLPTNQFTPDSNNSRCSDHTRSSPPTNYHMSPNDARYELRHLPSFDTSMQPRISIPSKHRKFNPQLT